MFWPASKAVSEADHDAAQAGQSAKEAEYGALPVVVESAQHKGDEMVNIYWLRGKIGDAVWLWIGLNGAVQQPVNPENEWFLVMTGNAIGDGQIGQTLFADRETVIGWRERLVSLGLIRVTPLTENDPLGLPCHRYEVVNVNSGAGQAQTPLTPPPHVN